MSLPGSDLSILTPNQVSFSLDVLLFGSLLGGNKSQPQVEMEPMLACLRVLPYADKYSECSEKVRKVFHISLLYMFYIAPGRILHCI